MPDLQHPIQVAEHLSQRELVETYLDRVPAGPELGASRIADLQAQIKMWLIEKDAVIIAHYYTDPLIQALAEGINFSEKAGLDTRDVMEVITKGAAQSWQMENRWQTMLKDDYDHGFAVDWMRKDLDIVSLEANKIGANIEVTELVNKFYKDIQKSDGGRWDTSSLLKRIKDL